MPNRSKEDLRGLMKKLEENRGAQETGQVATKTGFVGIKEAATVMNVGEDVVRKLVRRGELTTTRIGRRKYIAEADLHKYWERTKQEEQTRLADPNRLLTVGEVANILRFSEAQVYDMLNKGIILGFRIGAGAGSWRVQRRDLDEYVARQREQALKTKRA